MRQPLRARRVFRFFMELVGWTLAAAGVAAGTLTALAMTDAKVGHTNVPWACAAFTVTLFSAASLLLMPTAPKR
jgi:hypothetical protein